MYPVKTKTTPVYGKEDARGTQVRNNHMNTKDNSCDPAIFSKLPISLE
jgi:hypothetical protein